MTINRHARSGQNACERAVLATLAFRVRNVDGACRWVLSRAEPVRAADGALLYWIGLDLDIEQRKQAEFYLAEGQRPMSVGEGLMRRRPLREGVQRGVDNVF